MQRALVDSLFLKQRDFRAESLLVAAQRAQLRQLRRKEMRFDLAASLLPVLRIPNVRYP
jgi:hypothetical protein